MEKEPANPVPKKQDEKDYEKKEYSEIYSFGYGKHGQLGHGLKEISCLKPKKIEVYFDDENIRSIACGGTFSVALTNEGQVFSWGDIRGFFPRKEAQLRGQKILQIAAGAMHTFGLNHQGEVWAWGEETPFLKVSSNDRKARICDPHTLKCFNVQVTKIACGSLHTLMLSSSGMLWALGSNHSGQLGIEGIEETEKPKMVKSLGSVRIIKIACGGLHSLAISDANRIWCWGSNKYGQLGIPGTLDSFHEPRVIEYKPLSGYTTEIACGDYHSLAINSFGSLYSWGNGRFGQLGHNEPTNQPTPKFVSFFQDTKVIKISAGGGFGCSHSVVLTEQGECYSFGSGKLGQLGLDDTEDRYVPTIISHLIGKPILDIACGWLHTMVLVGRVDESVEFNVVLNEQGLGKLQILSNEILLQIFSFMDAITLCRLSVCSVFLSLLCKNDHTWQTITLLEFNPSPIEIKKLQTSQSILGWKDIYSDYHSNRKIASVNKKQTQSNVGFFQKFFSSFRSRFRQSRVLMLGLDAAGKTTILYKLKLGHIVTTIPTIGFNIETVTYKNTHFTVWDVGGPDKIRSPWRHYYSNINVLIFVVDSNDRERIDYARDELFRCLREEELKGVPLLVFANKQDLPNAMHVAEVTEALGLNERGIEMQRNWSVQATCATLGDGLYEGLDWIWSLK